MLSEFKEFIARGNVLDLAVGVIIGAGFAKIVTSLTDDVIMPIVGRVFGGLDFTNKYFVLSGAAHRGMSLDQARKAGANVLAYGSFANAVVNFLILAWVVFLIVRTANRVFPHRAETPAGPSETDLLAEIRDELRKSSSRA